ncbi:MAG: hypothetical protein M3247_08210 [Thermoproteota archaeon]|nr:hypothetical protein [Thermoproteota archaeon]
MPPPAANATTTTTSGGGNSTDFLSAYGGIGKKFGGSTGDEGNDDP